MKVGDQVTWTKISHRGRTVSYTLREGVLVKISGEMATVKKRNGHTQRIPLSSLRLKGQKSTLSDIVDAVRYSIKD